MPKIYNELNNVHKKQQLPKKLSMMIQRKKMPPKVNEGATKGRWIVMQQICYGLKVRVTIEEKGSTLPPPHVDMEKGASLSLDITENGMGKDDPMCMLFTNIYLGDYAAALCVSDDDAAIKRGGEILLKHYGIVLGFARQTNAERSGTLRCISQRWPGC